MIKVKSENELHIEKKRFASSGLFFNGFLYELARFLNGSAFEEQASVWLNTVEDIQSNEYRIATNEP